MSANSTKKTSLTDWDAVDQLADKDIDTGEVPALDETFFQEAELRLPKPKKAITIRIDDDIVDWFKSQGRGYQTRINAVLKMYVESQVS